MTVTTAERLRKISESVLSLPTLPTIQARLIELVDNPKVEAQDLAKLIAEDQALTARLLKVCNSAYYGLRNEVNTVDHAVVMLGFDTVREIALSVSVLQYFRMDPTAGGFDAALFWEHSACTASIARFIARKYRPDLSADAYLGGLLHDLGKLILMQYFPEDFAYCLEEANKAKNFLYEVEKELLGVDHAQVGIWLALKWKLPSSVCACIAHHHKPWAAEEKEDLVACIALANMLAQYSQFGDSGNKKLPMLEGPLAKSIGRTFPIEDPAFLAQLVRAVHQEVQAEVQMVRELLTGFVEE